ncbi:glycosyltransferase family 2 protein [Candidatus Daviesbacteria bacterium]|nr:glycosyltransferase family 2 protein [Candidatus Daviesbacteria bacterium]
MDKKISVVINTLNEEKNLERVLKSVKWADEIVVVDMHSQDKTVQIAKSFGAKVYNCQKSDFVEPARNFAISKASNQWVMIVDADEEIGDRLKVKLRELVNTDNVEYVRIPRKNLIFGKWMKATGWWPDYNIRFFKKGLVVWSDKIHIPPQSQGQGVDLPAEEALAIIHYHYESMTQYLERLNRYTTIQAREINKNGYQFSWSDLIKKPMEEFLGRFFAQRGYEDGLHGLSLSILQAFSFFVVYLKLWEMDKFTIQEIKLKELKDLSNQCQKDLDYWFRYSRLSKNPLKRLVQRISNKL